MEQKVYRVRRSTNIVGYDATYYVLANNEREAIKCAFPHDCGWWVRYCRYYAEKVS